MAVFIINRPTRGRVANDLELSQTERALIDDPNAVVAEVKAKYRP